MRWCPYLHNVCPFISPQVLHSQRINETPLKPWVIIANDGQVCCAHCTCMAGIAEACTHVGALLFKIEAAVRIHGKKTVTDVPAYWKIPAGINKVHGEVAHKIDFTSAKAQRIALDRVINDNSPMPGLRTRASRHTPQATLDDLSSLLPVLHKHRAVCMSTMETYFHDYADPVQPAVMPKPLQDRLRDPQFDNAPLSVLLQHCETVKDIAAVSKKQANIISTHTKQQHNSSAWYGVRAGRVTASAMHAVVVCNIEKPAVSTVRKLCYPTALLSTQDTRWGIEHEETARSVYQAKQAPHHIDLKIELSGFCINPEFPQVGASPDGLLHCICCGKGCLEIKCPAKHKNNTVQEACDGDRDFCLQLVDNTYQLKQGHRYYTQVQTQISLLSESCQMSWAELICRHYTQDASTPQTSRVMAVKSRNTVTVPQVRGQKRARKRTTEHKENMWCVCQGPEELDDMVACDNENCVTQWYHLPCVGLDATTAAGDSWFFDACM